MSATHPFVAREKSWKIGHSAELPGTFECCYAALCSAGPGGQLGQYH